MSLRIKIIHGLFSFFQSDEPALSFYGVYDGHAGKDAAAFAASHLHGRIIQSTHYPTDPVKAIQDAFNRTDEAFLEKVRTLTT